jgi:prevent-host-death family protein
MNEYTVGLRELKANLNKYMRRVKAGEKIAITERGKPIGWIVPVGDSPEQKIQVMLEARLVHWSGKKLQPYQATVINQSDKLISDIVSELRE